MVNIAVSQVDILISIKKAGTKAFQDLSRDLEKTKKSIQNINQVSGELLMAGAKLTAFGAGMTALAAVPVKFAASFEQGMAKVKALSGATADGFRNLSLMAKDLGRTTKFTAKEAAEGMGFLAMAGFETQQIMAAMPDTLQLAASATMDLGTAADITTNILTGYGLEVSELNKANDVLVKAFTSANVDLTMLGESLKMVGPIARSAGVEFEEITAAIGRLGSAGIQGSLAGTSLRRAISNLINPVGRGAKVMEELGIKVKDDNDNFIGLANVIGQFEDKLKDVEGGAERTAIIMEIFGQRAGPAMAALIDQGSVSLEKFTNKLRDSAGIAERIATIELATLEGAFKLLTSALTGMSISAGEAFLKPLQGIIRMVALVINKMTEWYDSLGIVADVVLGLIGTVGLFVTALGVLMVTLGGLGFALTGLITGYTALQTLIPIVSGLFATQINILPALKAGYIGLSVGIKAAIASGAALQLALRVGLVGAIIFTISKVVELVNIWKEYTTTMDRVRDSQQAAALAAVRLRKSADIQLKSLDELKQLTSENLRLEVQRLRNARLYYFNLITSLQLSKNLSEVDKKRLEDAIVNYKKVTIAAKEANAMLSDVKLDIPPIEVPEVKMPDKSLFIARLENDLKLFTSLTKTALQDVKIEYEKNLIDVEEYYNKKKELADEQFTEEDLLRERRLGALNEELEFQKKMLAEGEVTGEEKITLEEEIMDKEKQRIELETQIQVKREEFARTLTKIDQEHIKEKDKIVEKEEEVANSIRGIVDRIAGFQQTADEQALAQLDIRHEEELKSIGDSVNAKKLAKDMEILHDAERNALLEQQAKDKADKERENAEKNASMLLGIRDRVMVGMQERFNIELEQLEARQLDEVESLIENGATLNDINIALDLQNQEREQLAADQHKRLMEFRLESANQMISGMGTIFNNLYQLSGKSNKEMLIAAKAAGIAQVMVSTAIAAMKAWELGPILGPIMAALAVAQGVTQIAMIASQRLAVGGPVIGGGGKKDDVPIMAMGGEFMQPVETVKYYGMNVMEALRKRLIPKDIFAGFSLPSPNYMPKFAFQAGGIVPAAAREEQQKDINITNIVDPGLFDQYINSPEGQKSIVNVMATNSYQVKRALQD